MDLGQLETVLEFRGGEQLVFMVLVDGQDIVEPRSRQADVALGGGQGHGERNVHDNVHDLFRSNQRNVDDEVEDLVFWVAYVGHWHGEKIPCGSDG